MYKTCRDQPIHLFIASSKLVDLFFRKSIEMSEQKDNDDSKKAQAATNLGFTDDENLEQQEPQIQDERSEQQKDTIPVPERDPLDDSGVFSPAPVKEGAQAGPLGATAQATPKPTEDKSEKSPSSKRVSRRSPSMDRLKAGAEALYKNVKEAVKTVLRSSSSSPKKESLTDEAKEDNKERLQVKEEGAKKKRNLSMVSMASQTTDTDPDLDSGVTEMSILPESDTFDKSVAPLPCDESMDNLAERVDKMDVPEVDKTEEAEMETDLPEADKYKASDDKKDDGKKDTDKPADNKE